MIVTVLIKGSVDQAKCALSQRGLVIYGAQQIKPDTVRGFIRDTDALAMNDWFIEPCGDPPYPAGTLLHWAPAGPRTVHDGGKS